VPIAILAGIVLQLLAIGVLFLRQGGDRDAAERQERRLKEDLAAARDESARAARGLRDEVSTTLKTLSELQKTTLDGVAGQMARLGQTVEMRLAKLQEDNGQRLEQMRQTVDEKLQGTLEKRLGESFKLVSERLEQVHKGLGEMQTLALGVGDLKKVLSNVKTRGIWGEVQLGNLLEQMLTQDQFMANAVCRPGSAERVEYVVRMPGRGDSEDEVWLPIDAKFPREDYERLLDAVDRADPLAVEEASRALENRVKQFAKDIATKYIYPPRTTDFAILFLPTEGLYAELLRRPGLADQLQREWRVNLCGPTTLGALLNSLQMGFRSLAIQQRSSEVWQVLGAVKTEFSKYGEVLDKVQKKLTEASNTIEEVSVRRRVIDRKLRSVDALDVGAAQLLLSEADGEG
jgi:DNA recombination protein RmuC